MFCTLVPGANYTLTCTEFDRVLDIEYTNNHRLLPNFSIDAELILKKLSRTEIS